jgi:iron complex outermembrane receptor protein
MSWADSTYSDIANPPDTALESRQLLSARIGYEWQQASVYLFGSNLLNDEYALSRFDNSKLLNPAVSGQVGPSRAFGIGCEFKW